MRTVVYISTIICQMSVGFSVTVSGCNGVTVRCFTLQNHIIANVWIFYIVKIVFWNLFLIFVKLKIEVYMIQIFCAFLNKFKIVTPFSSSLIIGAVLALWLRKWEHTQKVKILIKLKIKIFQHLTKKVLWI